MIPAYCSDDISSSGEKQLFQLIRNDPVTAEWVCLHSLGLARHVSRVYGEIDFVVLVPNEGVFCLEIKSGRVARREGVWVYTNRYGDVSTSTVGPFIQARDGMFSLLEAVRKRFGRHHRLARIVYGFGVVFPHVSFAADDPEIESWQVYDRNSRRQPVSKFILNLAKYTRQSVQSQSWYDGQESRPSTSQIRDLADFLRGDFEKVIKPSDVLHETEERILRLTAEQYRCLDQLQDNPRCLFDGGAGTGKTLLAVEFARREALSGKSVLLLCYNKLLGRWLASQRTHGLPPSIEVDYFHNFLNRVIAASSLRTEFEIESKTADKNYLYCELYPLYALDALSQDDSVSFDTLIIDEGQDLIRPEFLDVFDGLLDGGLAGGHWAIFCDFRHQRIYRDTSEDIMISEIEQRALRYTRFRLLTNCRNTRPIGEEVSLISGCEVPPFLPTNLDGVPVNYRFYTDDMDQRRQINEIVKKHRSDGIEIESITILSPKRLDRSCLAEPERLSFKIVDLTSTGLSPCQGREIAFSTIHAFKGLESSTVIITDITHLVDERNRALLYVGMSRARYSLSVLVSESAREEYQAAIRRSLQKGTE